MSVAVIIVMCVSRTKFFIAMIDSSAQNMTTEARGQSLGLAADSGGAFVALTPIFLCDADRYKS
jgi:hypothetical protein